MAFYLKKMVLIKFVTLRKIKALTKIVKENILFPPTPM